MPTLRARLALLVTLAVSALHCAGATTVDRSCVRERGCPTAIAPPQCAQAPANVIELHDARTRAQELVGQTVSVRGYLTRVGNVCTRRACTSGACCNTCDGSVALASAPDPEQLASPLPPHLLLGEGPEWQCTGDETGQCCRYALWRGGAVVATGTLVASPDTPAGFRIAPVSVCHP